MSHCHCSGTNAYIKAVYELSDLINVRFRTFPYHNDLIFYLSPHGFRYRKACKVAHSHTGKTIWTTAKMSVLLDLIPCSVTIHWDFTMNGWYFTHCYISRVSLQILIHYLVCWRGSHEKEKRSTKGREGAGPHTGQEKPRLPGYTSVCKSMLCDIHSNPLISQNHIFWYSDSIMTLVPNWYTNL